MPRGKGIKNVSIGRRPITRSTKNTDNTLITSNTPMTSMDINLKMLHCRSFCRSYIYTIKICHIICTTLYPAKIKQRNLVILKA